MERYVDGVLGGECTVLAQAITLIESNLLRKTNASLSKKAGVDPRVASDQRGHGIGVSLEVYTNSDMEQKRAALKKLEAAVLRKPQPQALSA